MNATDDRAKTIFLNAAEIESPEERHAFVAVECAGDDALRREVGELLRHQRSLGGFLESPPEAVDGEQLLAHGGPLMEQPGTFVGPYKLLQQIGEGGFGVVFMAEQTQPVRRIVALKIIKPGMDTREVIARFEAERQALAMMDHPNIAKVLDAGATGSGRPYFVMELVRGVPITQYCDQCNLTTRERLELFLSVCQAVQHAHQNGVIHRDLKPTNVLVALQDGRPAAKIIDFGVAKAIGQRLTEHSMVTAFAQMVGTPLYMSPEQAELSRLGVDTRSDIYSLGVMLYELLTGTTPFEKDRLHAAPYDELRRIIREEEPPRPSARLSTLAADLATTIAEHRRSDSRRLKQQVHGDLDWIVMRCLEKDRNRRYEAASALAADVRRYLADEPVTAGPPSRLYRASKFVKRNKVPVFASAAVFIGLVAGIIGMAVGLVSQSRQRAAAVRERAEAQLNLALSLQSQAKYAEAEALFRQGLASTIGSTPEDRQRAAHTRLRLANVVYDRGDTTESERLHRDALAAYRANFPPGDPNIAQALGDLVNVLQAQQRFAEAEPLIREARDIHRRTVPTNHFSIATSSTVLGDVLITLGRYAEAEPILREAITEHQRVVPPDDWALAVTRTVLGRDLIMLGKFSAAETQLLDAERVLSSTEDYRRGRLSLAALYARWDQAEPGKGYDAKAREWFRKLIGTFVPPEPATIEANKSD